MRISDWRSDVLFRSPRRRSFVATCWTDDKRGTIVYPVQIVGVLLKRAPAIAADRAGRAREHGKIARFHHDQRRADGVPLRGIADPRSEEHTSELQSLMRISYAVFCLKKKK